MFISDFVGESNEYDKKLILEEKRPKSWLKSVSAFANGKGGILFFGVADDDILRILPGVETPYYYVGDGSRTAFVRVGNESVQAGAIELKRLVLRGSNQTYDSLSSYYPYENYAFTKLRSVYR